ncbi:MAG: hypothetical protein ACXQS8_05695 [Candidatus Helarchaeales archaeon]
MSETAKNYREVRGAWFGFIGGVIAVIFSIIALILGPSFFSNYPIIIDFNNLMNSGFFRYLNDLQNYFTYNVSGVPSPGQYVTIGYNMVNIILIGGIIAIAVGLLRKKLFGMSLSGFFLIVSLIIVYFGLAVFSSLLTIAQTIIQTYVGIPEIYGFSINPIPLVGSLLIIIIAGLLMLIGAFQLFMARPIPVASYRRKRMQYLAKADTLERAGNPVKAIKFYEKAADLSMKLKEEDKATEYYAKAREIHETAIEQMMKIEEERKRRELAERRAKLEEERKEILQKADEAEEKQDYMRAFHLYREAADRSVDLGQKKLAAQFTAKAKELRRKAKQLEKSKKEKELEEQRRKREFERKQRELEKKAEKL